MIYEVTYTQRRQIDVVVTKEGNSYVADSQPATASTTPEQALSKLIRNHKDYMILSSRNLKE